MDIDVEDQVHSSHPFVMLRYEGLRIYPILSRLSRRQNDEKRHLSTCLLSHTRAVPPACTSHLCPLYVDSGVCQLHGCAK